MTWVSTANGPVQRIIITVQLKVLDKGGYGMTRWFDEEAIILEDPVEGLEDSREETSGQSLISQRTSRMTCSWGLRRMPFSRT